MPRSWSNTSFLSRSRRRGRTLWQEARAVGSPRLLVATLAALVFFPGASVASPVHLPSDTQIVRLLGRDLDLAPVQKVETSATPTGEQLILVALINFADLNDQPVSLADLKPLFQTNTDSLDAFIRANSYGKAWLNVTTLD